MYKNCRTVNLMPALYFTCSPMGIFAASISAEAAHAPVDTCLPPSLIFGASYRTAHGSFASSRNCAPSDASTSRSRVHPVCLVVGLRGTVRLLQQLCTF